MKIEDQLVEHLIGMNCAASGPHLYHFNNGHWIAHDWRSHPNIFGFCSQWIEVNARGYEQARRILRAAIKTMNDVCPLPNMVRHGPVLIPFRNTTLELYEDGCIRASEPNPQDGLTFAVPMDINDDQIDENWQYTPQPGRADSAWGNFLRTFAPTQSLQDRFAEGFGATLTNRTWGKVIYLHGPTGTAKTTITKIIAAYHSENYPSFWPTTGSRLTTPEWVGMYYNASLFRCSEKTLTHDRKALEAWVHHRAIQGRHKCERNSDFEVIPTASIVMDESESKTAPADPLLFALPLTHSILKGQVFDFDRVIIDNPSTKWEALEWLLTGASRVVQRGHL